jgi:hypothetical protein
VFRRSWNIEDIATRPSEGHTGSSHAPRLLYDDSMMHWFKFDTMCAAIYAALQHCAGNLRYRTREFFPPGGNQAALNVREMTGGATFAGLIAAAS